MNNTVERVNTETGHWYRDPKTGAQIPGVTTVLKVLPKEALDNWKLRKAVTLALKGEKAHKACPEGMDPVVWLTAAGDREAMIKANIGTGAHNFAEQYMLGNNPSLEDLPEKERYHAESFLQFVRDKNPQPVLVEKVVTYIDPSTGIPLYCGTIDLVAELPDEYLWLIDYKAPIATDTPIITPIGWTNMGELKIGDTVFDIDGNQVKIVNKSEVKMNPCFRVTFDDKSSIICDEEHPWLVVDSYPPSKKGIRRIVKTKDLESQIWNGKKIPQRKLHVEVPSPLKMENVFLPLNPYVLGAWLGDGKTTGGSITIGTKSLPILKELQNKGWTHTWSSERRPGTTQYGFTGLQTKLKEVGVFGHKHIPDNYLRSSSEQRLSLLQGLMDTDGSWNKPRKTAVFVNTNKELAIQVRELVLSLGERASLIPYTAHGFGKTIQSYFVEWRPRQFNPFLIAYKRDQAIIEKGLQNWRRTIIKVEPTLMVPTQCITTDSPTSTFLCGEVMIPTHNSSSQARPSHALQAAAYSHATHWLDEDTCQLHPMPKVDRAAVVLLNGGSPDKSYRWFRLDNSEIVFSVFKSLLRIHNFSKVEYRILLGELD